jgi:hypothetical protein
MEDVIGALPKKLENAKEFKTKIEEHFQGSSMANASMHAKYDGHGSVRGHILNLKDLEMPLPKPYLVDYIMVSLMLYLTISRLTIMGVITSGP